MTLPSINSTFDTSLIDLKPNMSFSTTESDPSDAGTSTNVQSLQTPDPLAQDTKETSRSQAKTSTSVQHIGTQEAYDQWAPIYDTDGNMLQSIDDDELDVLLPPLLNATAHTCSTVLNLLDLGCGTGRNTARLLLHSWPPTQPIAVTGLDFSASMLALARGKLAPLVDAKGETTLTLHHCNPFSPLPLTLTPPLQPQHLILSTLVLEHIPLPIFFYTLSLLLSPGGVAVVTNMHPEMGSRSQAGFVNSAGVKVRGESYVHGVDETVRAAEEAGLKVVSVRERSVRASDVESGVVGERGRKWVGCKVWFGVVVKRG